MIEAKEMIKRHGKQKFVEMATRSQPKQTGHYIKHQRRWGTNIKYRMCEHGVFVIENYEPKQCKDCRPEIRSKSVNFNPYFNAGLGGWVESRSDEKRTAKRLGLVEAG